MSTEIPSATSPSTEAPTSTLEIFPALTTTEREILKLIVKGYTNHETAKEMLISVKTYDTHRGHILNKLGLKGSNTAGNVRLVHAALRYGLVTLDDCLPTPHVATQPL